MPTDEADAIDGEPDEGLAPTAAFKTLGNGTRMAILQSLWAAEGPDGDTPVPFSELRRRVDVADSGQFNYHLDKLVGHFVADTGDGYALTWAGFAIVQAVIAGSGFDAPRFGPEPLAEPCPSCGADAVVAYADGGVAAYCLGCDGLWNVDPAELGLGGYIGGIEFPPAGLQNRSPEDILEATAIYLLARSDAMLAGVCPDCGGTVESTLAVCEDHDAGAEPCDVCRRPFLGVLEWRCVVCKGAFGAPSWVPTVRHPAVQGFLHEHGIDPQPRTLEGLFVGLDWDETVESTDPLRLAVTVRADGDELRTVVDGEGSVVEVEQ